MSIVVSLIRKVFSLICLLLLLIFHSVDACDEKTVSIIFYSLNLGLFAFLCGSLLRRA